MKVGLWETDSGSCAGKRARCGVKAKDDGRNGVFKSYWYRSNAGLRRNIKEELLSAALMCALQQRHGSSRTSCLCISYDGSIFNFFLFNSVARSVRTICSTSSRLSVGTPKQRFKGSPEGSDVSSSRWWRCENTPARGRRRQ